MKIKRSQLFRIVDITTEEPVNYVGVYVLHWHDRPKEPEVGFAKIESDDEIVD